MDTPQGLPTPAQEIRLRAIGLARVLAIPAVSFTARERPAYMIMSYLAAMPTQQDHGRRRALGNEILQNCDRVLPMDQPQNAQFNAHVRELVITMQEFPAWYTKLSKSNEEIVDDYVLVATITKGMKIVGMGGLGSASGGIVKGALKGGQAVAGQGARALGMAGARGAMTGAMGAATGGLAGPLAVAWVVGSVAYLGLEARLNELGQEITRRYQEQKLSQELYQRAFGHEVALPQRYFYAVR